MSKKFALLTISLFFILIYSSTSFGAPWINMEITYNGKIENYSAENVYLYVNGKQIENLTMPPIIFEGSTLVPAREVFEPLGAEVDWNKETQEVIVTYNDNLIKIKINSETALVNDIEKKLSMPPKIINNKTMIPARFIAESLGMKVEWNSDTRIINIRDISFEINPSEIIFPETTSTEETSEETTFENTTTKTTQRDPVDLKDPECYNGIFRISANGNLGDFASPKKTNKKLIYILSKTNLPPKESYSFDDDYIKKAAFENISINNKSFTQITLYLKKDIEPITYISNDLKTFVVDFINEEPLYDDICIVDDDEEPFASDFDLNPDGTINTNKNSQPNIPEISSNENVFFENNYLYIKKGSNFNIDITEIDNYQNHEYIINTSCDLSKALSQGKYTINNALIDYVEITHSSTTTIKIKEKKVLAYNIIENTEYICINPIAPNQKYSKIVVIDPGHGGKDPGAESSGNDLTEKDLTLSIAKKTVDLIEKDKKIKAYATRLDDIYYTRPERVNFANELGDLFISIHMNSFSGEKANGTEVWYYPHNNDSSIGISCEDIAAILQKNLTANLKSTDRGIKSTDYDVLCLTKIPAALCEIGFITNPAEAAKLKTDEYKNLAADAIYKSIIEIFEKYTPQR